MIEEESMSGKSNWKVSFFFNNEEDALAFEENGMTAFHCWRFSTGRLSKPHCDLSSRDEEESASLKKTEHSSTCIHVWTDIGVGPIICRSCGLPAK